MQFQSTRNPQHRVGLSEAIGRGLAPEGGLYVPTELPAIDRKAFDGVHTIPEVAEVLLRPFAAGDAIATEVPAIVRDAFNFPAPLLEVAGAARKRAPKSLNAAVGP
jgi:threonine synthase